MALMYLLVLWVAAAAVAVAAAAAAFALAHHHLGTKYRRQLAEAEAKWHLQHQQDSPGTVIENVSLGWLNLLLQSLWAPVLEKHVAGLTTELLQKVFAEVLTKNGQKAPWKYLDSIDVEELSFGLVPPTLQVASAKFDPTASMLTISMDVRFTSSSAQGVLLAKTKAVAMLAPMTVRMEVTHVKLRGRLRLGFLLGPEAPGIQGMYYSFTSPPHLDMAVRPLGLPLPSVMPGVESALRGVLSKLISRRIVEPQRRYLDIHRIYLNKHIARVGGPGGLLKVMVLSASNLAQQQQQQQPQPAAAVGSSGAESPDALRSKGKASSSKASSSSSAAKLSSYGELRFGSTVLRTPIVHHSSSADAVWNWQFSLALPHELDAWPAAGAGAAGVAGGRGGSSAAAGSGAAAGSSRSLAGGSDSSDVLSLVLFDAQTVGQPVVVGKTKVSLCPLQLQPNGPARTLVLPLHKASSGRATVQVSVQWLKSTKQVSPQMQQQRLQQQMQRAQQGQRAAVPPSLAKEQLKQPVAQPPQLGVDAGPPSPPIPRSASAFAPASKLVSWQDKTQLRAKSAAAAAKSKFQRLVNSSSSTDSLQALQGAAVPAAPDRRSPDVASPTCDPAGQASRDKLASAKPWSTPAAGAASAAAMSTAAASTADSPEQRPRTHEHGSPAGRAQSHTGAPYLAEQGGMGPSDGAAGSASSSWLSYSGWRGLSSWVWPEAGPAQETATAASSLVASLQPSMRPPSTSPWPAGRDGEDDEDDQEGWYGSQSSMSSPADADGRSSMSPLALLSHVVHMQKELEQQRAQLEVMQQQLDRTSNSYEKLKQVCRQRGRAALLQGARFVLHKADGSTQHVLLYLTSAGSTRGGQPSRLGRPQQAESGIVLVLAALPETRREARLAFRRMATLGPGEGAVLGAGAAPAAVGSDSSADSGSSAAASSSAGGASNAGDRPRLGAFGSVGAGLRMRLQRGTMLQMGYEGGKFPRSTLQQLMVVPASQLVGVVRGSAHFPGHANSSSAGGASAASCAAECFSLLVQEDSTHSSNCVTAINLQLPSVGNGRCLDEWLLAVRDVVVAVQPAVQPAPAAQAVSNVSRAAGVTSPRVTGPTGSSAAHPSQAAAGQVVQAAASSPTDSRVDAAYIEAGQPPAAGVQAGSSTGLLRQSLEHAVGLAKAGSMQLPVTPPARADSGTQHTLEGWVLPAAAAAKSKPWAGAAPSGIEHDGGDTDSDESDTDTDDMA